MITVMTKRPIMKLSKMMHRKRREIRIPLRIRTPCYRRFHIMKKLIRFSESRKLSHYIYGFVDISNSNPLSPIRYD
jgi:hypothetical protein